MALPWSPKPMTGVRFANLLPFQHGRVVNTGIGIGLQNRDNVGPIPTSLSNIFKTFGYVAKHDGPNPSTVPNDG